MSRKKRFSSAEEAVDAFKNHVMKVHQAEWKQCFGEWFKRIQKCIGHEGKYFENINNK